MDAKKNEKNDKVFNGIPRKIRNNVAHLIKYNSQSSTICRLLSLRNMNVTQLKDMNESDLPLLLIVIFNLDS